MQSLDRRWGLFSLRLNVTWVTLSYMSNTSGARRKDWLCLLNYYCWNVSSCNILHSFCIGHKEVVLMSWQVWCRIAKKEGNISPPPLFTPDKFIGVDNHCAAGRHIPEKTTNSHYHLCYQSRIQRTVTGSFHTFQMTVMTSSWATSSIYQCCQKNSMALLRLITLLPAGAVTHLVRWGPSCFEWVWMRTMSWVN